MSHQRLTTLIERRLLKYDRLRQRVVEIDGHPAWQGDPDFRLDRHVMCHSVDGPLDDQKLTERVAELGNRPLEKDRPL